MPKNSFPFNLHNKQFRSSSNTANGEVTAATRFHYRQRDQIVWATYEGGQILFGTLSGFMNEKGELNFHYQHQNLSGEFMTGKCLSIPEIGEGQPLRFKEYWQWTTGDQSKGESLIEEIGVMNNE